MFRGAKGSCRQEAIRKFALPGSSLLALLLGIAVYLLDRDWSSTLFLAPLVAHQPQVFGFFGSLGQVLPSFLHAYAFALLLILALGSYRYARHVGALGWFTLAAGLEVLQADHFHALFAAPVPQHAASAVLGGIQLYVVNGHFDPRDLLAAGLGCVAAFAIASVLEEQNEHPH